MSYVKKTISGIVTNFLKEFDPEEFANVDNGGPERTSAIADGIASSIAASDELIVVPRHSKEMAVGISTDEERSTLFVEIPKTMTGNEVGGYVGKITEAFFSERQQDVSSTDIKDADVPF